MVGRRFIYAVRTSDSLQAVVRGGWWLGDSSKWLVSDLGKSLKTLARELAHVGPIRPTG